MSVCLESVNREEANDLQPQIWTYSGVLINYSSLMSVPSGEKQGWGKEERTYVSSTNHAVWDEPRVIPWLSTVRDDFRLDITYQILFAAIDVERSPETKVVDAVEGDETRVGRLVDIRADGVELGSVGIGGAVGEAGGDLGVRKGGEGEEGGEE